MNVGPYTYVSRDVTRGRYRLVLYGAFNAMGLIGSEHNGIAVLDNQEMMVVADRLFEIPSGYNGPSASQWRALETMMTCSPKEFADIINSSGRNRYEVLAKDVAPRRVIDKDTQRVHN